MYNDFNAKMTHVFLRSTTCAIDEHLLDHRLHRTSPLESPGWTGMCRQKARTEEEVLGRKESQGGCGGRKEKMKEKKEKPEMIQNEGDQQESKHIT